MRAAALARSRTPALDAADCSTLSRDLAKPPSTGCMLLKSRPAHAGDALAAFIECLSLPDTPGVLVFTLITPEDSFNDAYIAATEVLDSIDLHGTTTQPGDQQTGQRPSPDHNNDETGERP